MSSGIHTRRHPFALAVAVLAGLALALVAGPAYAHDELIGSDPAAGSQVAELPSEITMTFSGVLLDEPGATEVVVTDAEGNDLTALAPVLDGTRLTQGLVGSASGTVTVTYRVVSSDGHPVSDRFTFTVGTGDAPPATATPLPSAPTDGAPSQGTGAGIVWIVLGVLVVALGGGVVAVLVARTRRARED